VFGLAQFERGRDHILITLVPNDRCFRQHQFCRLRNRCRRHEANKSVPAQVNFTCTTVDWPKLNGLSTTDLGLSMAAAAAARSGIRHQCRSARRRVHKRVARGVADAGGGSRRTAGAVAMPVVVPAVAVANVLVPTAAFTCEYAVAAISPLNSAVMRVFCIVFSISQRRQKRFFERTFGR
jgi:hypothetical protein